MSQTSDEEDIIMFLKLYKDMQATSANTEMHAQNVKIVCGKRLLEENRADEHSESDSENPGKGNTLDGAPKALYARRSHSYIYKCIRFDDPDILLFGNTVQITREYFDDLHELAESELLK